jgi:DtxR family transcriptional regulator, Mn-dependent transcriptional regulator
MAPPQAEASQAVEDYAKAIYSLERRRGEPVTTSAIADRLGVSPASVSAMVKRLATLGLVDHEPYQSVRLTSAGERIALAVIRHHRLLELYLSEALGMPWDRVHDEAEVLEHAISRELSELIAAKLGHPTHDPHGDPIPTADGKLQEPETASLQSLDAGDRGTFTRVSDANPELLRYLATRQILSGMRLEVVDKQPFEGPLTVRLGDRRQVLGGAIARAMRVQLDPALRT